MQRITSNQVSSIKSRGTFSAPRCLWTTHSGCRVQNVPRAGSIEDKATNVDASTSPLAMITPALIAAPFMVDVQGAMAKDGAFGLLEGTSAALVHPAMMFTLLASSLYAAYLGFQWRRTREVGQGYLASLPVLSREHITGFKPCYTFTPKVTLGWTTRYVHCCVKMCVHLPVHRLATRSGSSGRASQRWPPLTEPPLPRTQPLLPRRRSARSSWPGTSR